LKCHRYLAIVGKVGSASRELFSTEVVPFAASELPVKNVILAMLLLQNGPQAAGVVTGMVHGPNGMPASGVRVFALEAREGIDASKTAVALEGISVTDETGRYKLEIAAGRYYITLTTP
jgi:hypothetical protein